MIRRIKMKSSGEWLSAFGFDEALYRTDVYWKVNPQAVEFVGFLRPVELGLDEIAYLQIPS